VVRVPGSIPSDASNNWKEELLIAIMLLKMGEESLPETSCILNTPVTMGSVRHNCIVTLVYVFYNFTAKINGLLHFPTVYTKINQRFGTDVGLS
jgi:hypothetical protein